MGLGIHGERYARHLAEGAVADARLAAVWSRSWDKARGAAERWGVAASARPEDLAARPDVDAVVIVVPVGLHPELVALSAARGHAILLEKPMARSGEEGERIIRTASKLTIAQTLRFDPLFERLVEAAGDPALGPLRGFSFEQRLEPRGVAWEDVPELAGGGVLMQTGIHLVDALLFLLRPECVEVVDAFRDRIAYARCEDVAQVILRLRGGRAGDGVAGTLVTSKLGASRHQRLQLFFEAGGLEADFVDRALILTRGRSRAREVVPPAPTIVRVLDAFVRYVHGRGPNPVPAEEALEAVRVVKSAYEAAVARTDGGWLRPTSSEA